MLMSTLRKMICVCDDCGYDRTHLANALRYLPQSVLEEWQDRIALFTMTGRQGIRIRKDLWQDKEIVFISDRVIPRSGTPETDRFYRFFIIVVLHEIAHVALDHPFDRNPSNEDEADQKAKEWFNQHVEEMNSNGLTPPLLPISCKEIKETRGMVEERVWTYNSTMDDSSQYLCAFFNKEDLQEIFAKAAEKDKAAEVLLKQALRDQLAKEQSESH